MHFRIWRRRTIRLVHSFPSMCTIEPTLTVRCVCTCRLDRWPSADGVEGISVPPSTAASTRCSTASSFELIQDSKSAQAQADLSPKSAPAGPFSHFLVDAPTSDRIKHDLLQALKSAGGTMPFACIAKPLSYASPLVVNSAIETLQLEGFLYRDDDNLFLL